MAFGTLNGKPSGDDNYHSPYHAGFSSLIKFVFQTLKHIQSVTED